MSKLGGRPRKPVDPELLERLAACGCTVNEMASVMQCDKRTLERRFATAISDGRNRGRSSLRHKQFQLAMRGDKTMLVWLGKQHLGQSDKLLLSRTQMSDVVNELSEAVRRHVPDPETQKKITDDWTEGIRRVVNDD